jgi:hypothetical protein
MLKIHYYILLFLFFSVINGFGQNLKLQSEDSLNNRPTWESYLLFKMKLNGVFDISGGIQGNETFNLNNVDVWGDDDTPNLWMDLHQSQVRFFAAKEIGKHRAVGYFEGDFWGGNNRFRLRMAYINYSFFQFGQDWSFFGDKEIWPNVFDWDGPSSGIWRRNPGLIFYKETNSKWKFETGIEQTQAQISFLDDLDSTFAKAKGNPTPEMIFTIKKSGDFGHIRLATILRFLHFSENGELGYVTGFGAALSGYLATNKKMGNPIQFQFVAGKGIASYIVSFDGANYDAAPDGFGNMHAIPAFGGWISYEHWISKIVHANIVLGLTGFIAENINEYYVPGGDFHVNEGSINLDFFYGLINIMVDPFEDFTVGIEYNIGNKENTYMGKFDDSQNVETIKKNRIAQRISFGLFYNF